jgi:hypothetical protein
MLTVCRRWDRDRRDAIQTAWFNGAGYEAWENVWGIWAGISTRDSAALKLLHPLLTYLGQAQLLGSAGWEPYVEIAVYL